jgi:hypothetical protein
MRVHIVRSADPGCEPQCPQWISAQGKIVTGTARRFREVLSQIGTRKLPIFIDSGGGSVRDALSMGRLIRARGLDVVVTKTAFAPCEPADAACRKAKTGGDLRGLAESFMSKCASSCAFVLAGGTRRLVGQGTGVGVHQISMTLLRYHVWTRRLVSERKVGQQHAQTRRTYADIRKYLAEMGIGDEVMTLIMSTPNDKIHWLTASELRLTGLATEFRNGEQLIAGTPPPAMPLVPPGPTPTEPASDVMGYNHLCAKLGLCPQGAGQSDPKSTSPGTPPAAAVPPPSAPPSAEAPVTGRGEDSSVQ